MPDILAAWEFLKQISPKFLAPFATIELFIIIYILKKKQDKYSTLESNFEILKGMKNENGQLTVYPKTVVKDGSSINKYNYHCSLQMNTIQSFAEGFHLRIDLAEPFKVIYGKNSEEKSVFKRPKHSVFLNSDLFTKTLHSERISSLDFIICSNQKSLPLELTVDFGSSSINSKLFLIS